MFAYCGNNPTSRSDETGDFWNFIVGAVVGAVVNAVSTAVDAVKEGGLDALSDGKTWAKIGAVSYTHLNAFLTCFFKKFQKIFRQMRDKYHYKAYVAFRMRENCTECRSNNSGSPIQYPIWPRPVSGRSYPLLPQKAASVWTRSHPRTSR